MIGTPPIVVSLSKSWIFLYSFVEIRDCLVVLTFAIIGLPPIIVGRCLIRVYLYFPVKLDNSLIPHFFIDVVETLGEIGTCIFLTTYIFGWHFWNGYTCYIG